MAYINFNNPSQNNNNLLASTADTYDIINGFGGIDTVSYLTAGSSIYVDLYLTGFQNTLGSGYDRLISIENVTGSKYDDVISGDGGNNVLDGDGGVNTVSYARATAGVTVNLANTAAQNTIGAGTDTLKNFRNIIGSRFNDTLFGDANNNSIDAGAGIDTISYLNAAAGISVSLAISGPQTTGGAGIDTLSNLENLTGSNFADKLTGNGSDNTISAQAGNDFVTATVGIDILDGGRDSDTASYQSLAGPVTLVVLQGVDKGAYGYDTLSNFEIVIGSLNLSDTIDHSTVGAPYTGTSTDLSSGSVILQGAAPRTLTVRDFEHVIGSGFRDTILGNNLSNILDGGRGDDIIKGNDGNDILIGGIGNDQMSGGIGNDFHEGGLGTDTLIDDSGIDIFSYTSAADSTVGAARDVISGFATGIGGDQIALTEIDANTTTAVDENFTGAILNSATFTANQQLRYQVVAGNLHLFGNIDGNNATAEFEIQINGIASISFANVLA